MTELEVQAIDEAYKALLIERFRVYVNDTDERSKYANGALRRFAEGVAHLREARTNIIKVMVGNGNNETNI